MKHSIFNYLAVLICFSFLACKKPVVETSFYYWKTKIKLSAAEKNTLTELNTQCLYIRFFDVDQPKGASKPQPVAVIEGLDSVPKSIEIIPVVFITNRTFIDLPKEDVNQLARNVISKIQSLKKNYNELQFDCDWSGKTKENYFLFLTEIRKQMQQPAQLSCTIRLHQVKYSFKTGVPPVNKGTLMFYNMGNLSGPHENNSIYDADNAKKYTAYIKGYKLPLDAALPVFRWYVHYRNNAVIGLITKKEAPVLVDTIHFLKFENNVTFKVKSDLLQNGIFYRTNDILKYETLSKEELMDAANLLRQNLKTENRKIIFYDLDEDNVNYYETKTFKEIMAAFN